MIVDGNKRKHNGKCGVVLTAEEARAEGVSGEVVLRLHEEGKVLGLASDQVCDVSDEAKWVSPLPRSAEAESATDAAFLQFILAASEDAKAQCNWNLPWLQIQEALNRPTRWRSQASGAEYSTLSTPKRSNATRMPASRRRCSTSRRASAA